MSGETRILIQNGEYWLANNGDLAMMDVTLGRLRSHWPEARLGVLTLAPWLLRSIAPTAEPVLARGAGRWPSVRRGVPRLSPPVVGPLQTARLRAGERGPQLARRIASRLFGAEFRARGGADTWVPQALESSSLVLALGGGYMTDVDAGQTARTLTLLEQAADRGIPSAMVGQGLGPLEDPLLLERARAVFPTVGLFVLREGLLGPQLLADLGVSPERVTVTGDDAIGLSLAEAQEMPGSGIGLCLRIAPYSQVSAGARDAVRKAIQAEARRVAAPLAPLYISEYQGEDRRATNPVLAGYPDLVAPLGPYAGPRAVARRVSGCRVVVTGAYHLAVFALSQGIPVVALTSSPYYDAKFAGLSAMFGDVGLSVVSLEGASVQSELADRIRQAWQSAPEVRAPLREHAAAQVRASEDAYRRVFDLLDGVVVAG